MIAHNGKSDDENQIQQNKFKKVKCWVKDKKIPIIIGLSIIMLIGIGILIIFLIKKTSIKFS